MMTDFAIVAEGFTDQVVIKNILLGLFADSDEEPTINFEQPLLDTTSQHSAHNPGGWSLVFKYFELGKFKQALQLNRFLIVHIDTDVCEQPGYDVPCRVQGRELSPEELVQRVVAKFRGMIGETIYAEHGHRFIFAVAVHSIECWLLPLIFQDSKKSKITGCLDAADHELRVQKRPRLRRGEGKDPEGYKAASAGYRKRKFLLQHRDDNPSLTVFLRDLEQRNITIPPPEL
ncbi:MAG TPA: hypothetical protein VE093_42655 [Polyangiaceae bacterium]|jgi:hypothetical protein|nr:hypothetical protein [Polyangiaceae bacterium]